MKRYYTEKELIKEPNRSIRDLKYSPELLLKHPEKIDMNNFVSENIPKEYLITLKDIIFNTNNIVEQLEKIMRDKKAIHDYQDIILFYNYFSNTGVYKRKELINYQEMKDLFHQKFQELMQLQTEYPSSLKTYLLTDKFRDIFSVYISRYINKSNFNDYKDIINIQQIYEYNGTSNIFDKDFIESNKVELRSIVSRFSIGRMLKNYTLEDIYNLRPDLISSIIKRKLITKEQIKGLLLNDYKQIMTVINTYNLDYNEIKSFHYEDKVTKLDLMCLVELEKEDLLDFLPNALKDFKEKYSYFSKEPERILIIKEIKTENAMKILDPSFALLLMFD